MNQSQAYGTYKVVVTVSVIAMAGIAAIALKSFRNISDAGMFAIALMVLAPAVLGIGVSYFVYLSSASASRAQAKQDDPFADDGIREIRRP
jgi:hypothetical protein